ncbi:type IV pilus inner membrane component PilO [Paralysiella testudinis]|uniref:Type 4a pilus biogenesis protein PilO n=1 Tax=Paralysiella testudinis TaxID=2809020 RepID=A0A892ZN82_9NEIS|nr:type 4a pilus biogenesis protein PilO [Paralysiella testudinis]QRQ83156.1 type 4a pilus biogenesis protein PilO [Paralysiella testudinis]
MAKNIKLNEIGVNSLHLLPKPAQIGLAAGIVILVWILAYFALFSSQLSEISTLQEEEIQLKEQYTQKSIQAANLDTLKQELVQLRSAFEVLLKQLPTDAEIPNLIQELHQAGATNGMRMNSVNPKAAVVDGNIEKLPYQISISGNYEQISQFTRDVGKLSRIVTLETLKLRRPSDKETNLTLDAVANTYKATSLSDAPADASAPVAQ